jgi:subfamily B ATP-binding cassette protein MsbA
MTQEAPGLATPSAPSRTDLWSEFLGLIRPYAPRVLLAFLCSLAASAANGGAALFVKPITDSVFIGKEYDQLRWMPFAIIGLFLLRGLASMLYSYLMKSAGMKLVRDYRIRIYEHLVSLPVSSLRTESSGRIISRLLNDTAVLRALVSGIMLDTLKEIPTITVLIGVAMYRRWDVSLLALIVLPGIVSGARRLGRKIKKKRKQAQQTLALVTHRIGEATAGTKVIKIFGRESESSARFAAENQTYYRQEIKIVRFREMNKMLVDICTGVGAALVMWYGGLLIVKGVITTGDFLSALGAIIMVFEPAKRLGNSYTMLQETRAALDRLKWLEAMPREEGGTQPLQDFQRGIRFESVSHRYQPQGDFVLKDVNLSIGKGEVVALVGPSGAGKTSLVDLIPRFFDPTSGAISIDGHNLRDLNLKDLRGLIGLVSQEVILFNDTIRANIAFGKAGASNEEIENAARLAYAHDFIAELPEGYDTLLGERGLNLSGGQRQRIAIARAILKGPPILILDEATSALDTVSESLVQNALERLMKGRTTIVVAHRLSTVINADKIAVMEHGRIVAEGTHQDLLKRVPLYRELYQTLAFQQETAAA